MLYWIAYGIPTIILLIALIYAVRRAGSFSSREEHQLDANARAAQERDDPKLRHHERERDSIGPTGSARQGTLRGAAHRE